MSKASVSEILLTIGVLICAAILLIQIQQIVKLKTKSAEAESIYMLGRDLEMLIDKTKIMDFAIYSYKPKIKHYTLEVEENKISVKDKISGHVYYFYVDEKVNPTVFEESEDICVVKQKIAKNTIKILPSNCNEVSFDFDEDIEEPTTPHNFFWPIESYIRITSCFGWRYNPAIKTQDFHTGIDLAIPIGTEIKAAEDGEVIKLMNGDGSIPIGDYGNYVILKHNFNGATYYTLYAHLKCSGVKVNVGDKVKKGDVIALSGGTDNCKGTSTGAHLHFEIREGTNNQRSSINPCLLLENCNCDISCEKYSQKDDPNKCPKS